MLWGGRGGGVGEGEGGGYLLVVGITPLRVLEAAGAGLGSLGDVGGGFARAHVLGEWTRTRTPTGRGAHVV